MAVWNDDDIFELCDIVRETATGSWTHCATTGLS